MSETTYISIWLLILGVVLLSIAYSPDRKQSQLDRIERTQAELMQKLNEVTP